jgi:hypothetical protein
MKQLRISWKNRFCKLYPSLRKKTVDYATFLANFELEVILYLKKIIILYHCNYVLILLFFTKYQ